MFGDQIPEQRKVITALFADVVGSTSIGESLDPEDVMEIVGGAITRMVGRLRPANLIADDD